MVPRCVSRRGLLSVLILVSIGACTRMPASETRQYELQGQILAIRPESGELLVQHGDIKNFMPAMTMPYKVRDRGLLDGKAPGDLVRATLVVAQSDAWLSAIEKTGTAPLADPAEIPPASFITPLVPGDRVPETALTDQDAKSVSLSAWRGTAVALTFIYTRCPLPQFCPLLDRRFAEVQRSIRSDPSLTGRAHLLSVSFDPDADTPQQLAAHAKLLCADPAVWRFATAPRDVVERFAARFGVNVIREEDTTITHNMRTAVIGADGRIVSVYNSTGWTPAQIIDDMRRAVAP